MTIVVYDRNGNGETYSFSDCNRFINSCSDKAENSYLYYCKDNYMASYEELEECCNNDDCEELKNCDDLSGMVCKELHMICCVKEHDFVDHDLDM